jgi:hypothetical protein
MHLNATLIRRRCYEALGGLDERFRRSEDYEFMLRLTRRFRGVNVPRRIISLRRHEGARGDSGIRHSARERQLVHFDFDAQAFETLRRETPLSAYIGERADTLGPQQCFEAWFVRSATMARHGLWEGFAEDIQECGRRRPQDCPSLTESMASKLMMVFSRADTIEAGLRKPGYPGFIVNAFLGALGTEAIRPIARGFYYAAREAHADGLNWLSLRCVVFAVNALMRGLLLKLQRNP